MCEDEARTIKEIVADARWWRDAQDGQIKVFESIALPIAGIVGMLLDAASLQIRGTPKTFRIIMWSDGGSPDAGFHLIEKIAGCRIPIEILCIEVNSMATIIALAGKNLEHVTVSMFQNGAMHFHNAYNAEKVKELSEEQQQIEREMAERIYGVVSDTLGISLEEAESFVAQEPRFTGNEAYNNGLINICYTIDFEDAFGLRDAVKSLKEGNDGQ